LLVFAVGGIVAYAVHRARQKAAPLEAQAEAEKARLASLISGATSPQNGKNPAAASDVAQALADLAAAAQNGSDPAAAERLKKQLAQLTAAAQDPKTQAALQDLNNKLAGLSAPGQNPGNGSGEDMNKDLAAIAAAASALGQGVAGGSDRTPAMAGGASTPSPSSSVPNADSGTTNTGVPTADTALNPPPVPSGPPMVPVAATGNQAHDWALAYERTVGGPEADLVVRTGDINNLGFGWPPGFDPFSGQSTPIHPGPKIDRIPPNAPPGTDRIVLGTGLTPVHMIVQRTAGKPDRIMIDGLTKTVGGDGYSWSLGSCFMLSDRVLSKTGDQVLNGMQLPPGVSKDVLQVAPNDAAQCTRDRQLTMPTPIVLPVGALPSKINAVVFQIFVDDFQSPVYGSHFQIALNGTRIPSFEYAINSLNQSGPIGKLVSLKLLPEYWPLLKSGTVKLSIDDPTSHVQDGFAVDFARILVNPHDFKYQVSLTATVTDAGSNKPIVGALVTAGLSSALTDAQGKCALKDIPAGLVVATANAPDYDQNSVPVDLPAGHSGNAEIQLHRHQENTAALEQSIAQTGTVAIYGIHFDMGSSKLRADSMSALNAVLGLINGRSGSRWIIAGHTDNQGSDALNIPLSKARAASVISWLTAHGIASDRLEPEGFGATRPVADNATANGRALNRRVEVSLAK
jgi:outer membrane protein OmpA-like peptidoglycan-associated protein